MHVPMKVPPPVYLPASRVAARGWNHDPATLELRERIEATQFTYEL
jgi:hypothetical protein